MTEIAAAYSESAAAWRDGPAKVYDRLAEVVVSLSPVPLEGRLVLDVGAGTGSAGKAVVAVGGRPVALDAAWGMLAVDRDQRPPAVVGDALDLPLPAGAVDGVVATFSLNHVREPTDALAEAARVTRRDGPIIASAYAGDDTHPVREAVNSALRARGWRPPTWHEDVFSRVVPALATPERCAAAAEAAGLTANVHLVRVPLPDLDALALVRWRLGMAHAAPFVGRLSPPDHEALIADTLSRLGKDWSPLERSILVITAVV